MIDGILRAGIGAAFLFLVLFGLSGLFKAIKKGTKKSVAFGSNAIEQARDRIAGVTDSDGKSDAFYVKAYNEIKANSVDEACWAKAFMDASGDEQKAQALYLKHRVIQLKREASQKYLAEDFVGDKEQGGNASLTEIFRAAQEDERRSQKKQFQNKSTSKSEKTIQEQFNVLMEMGYKVESFGDEFIVVDDKMKKSKLSGRKELDAFVDKLC